MYAKNLVLGHKIQKLKELRKVMAIDENEPNLELESQIMTCNAIKNNKIFLGEKPVYPNLLMKEEGEEGEEDEETAEPYEVKYNESSNVSDAKVILEA